jgi:hypothetical protein
VSLLNRKKTTEKKKKTEKRRQHIFFTAKQAKTCSAAWAMKRKTQEEELEPLQTRHTKKRIEPDKRPIYLCRSKGICVVR